MGSALRKAGDACRIPGLYFRPSLTALVSVPCIVTAELPDERAAQALVFT